MSEIPDQKLGKPLLFFLIIVGQGLVGLSAFVWLFVSISFIDSKYGLLWHHFGMGIFCLAGFISVFIFWKNKKLVVVIILLIIGVQVVSVYGPYWYGDILGFIYNEQFKDYPELIVFHEKYENIKISSVNYDDIHYSAHPSKRNDFVTFNIYHGSDYPEPEIMIRCSSEYSYQISTNVLDYLQNYNCYSDEPPPYAVLDNEIMNFDPENYKEVSIIRIPLGAVIEGHEYLIPEEITIILGKNNTVTWTNQDDTPHGFTSDKGGDGSWGTGLLKSGESSSVTFNQTGIFEYHGEPHPWMTGKIIVLEE